MNNYYQIIDGTTMYYPEYVEKLQEENKDLKEQLKGTTHCYDEEEHKRLVEENKYYEKENKAWKDLAVRQVHEIETKDNILTELEKWLKKRLSIKPMFTTYFFEMDGRQTSITEIEEKELSVVLDKLQELKGTNDDSYKR